MNEYHKKKLNILEKVIYDQILADVMSINNVVTIKNVQICNVRLNELIEAIFLDNPHIFWVDYYNYSYRSTSDFFEIYFTFFFNQIQILRLIEETNNWKKRIIKQIPIGFSLNERIWLIYDYLARQVTYGEQNVEYSHTILGPMSKKNHVSVCEGIAKSMKYLCDASNIFCIIVTGYYYKSKDKCEAHAWNIVESSYGLRHIDITAELDGAKNSGKAKKTEFLRMDSEMVGYDWYRNRYPRCI